MPDFECPSCKQMLSVGSEYAEQVILCPECAAQVTIPKPPSAPSPEPVTAPATDSPASGPDEDHQLAPTRAGANVGLFLLVGSIIVILIVLVAIIWGWI
ncbi:MAG: hypothetical protein FJ303_19630 [Planctomycetes bacterium]|nr:hypothetical protein [Planctomycetota bacterium]